MTHHQEAWAGWRFRAHGVTWMVLHPPRWWNPLTWWHWWRAEWMHVDRVRDGSKLEPTVVRVRRVKR